MLTNLFNKPLCSIFIIVAVVLGGCGGPTIENEIPAKLLKTEKTLPENMFGSLNVEVATSEERMNDLWQRFGFVGKPTAVNFEVNKVYFVGTEESGNCPLKFEGLGSAANSEEVIIHINNQSRACDENATPRAYVLSVEKEAVRLIQRLSAQVWYKSQAGYKLESVPIVRS